MLLTPTSSVRVTVARCSLAAFAALCSIHPMIKAFGAGDDIQSAADQKAPFLRDTPATQDREMGSDGQGGVSLPGWRGVSSSVKHAQIRPVAAAPGESVAASSLRVVATGVVGQPLVFSVRAMASADAAHMVDTGNRKFHNYEFRAASNLAPAARVDAAVNASPKSTPSISTAADGSTSISIPAIAGDSQVAWVYPQSATRQPDGTWAVKLGVGAVPQKDFDAYQYDSGRANAIGSQGAAWLAAILLSTGYGLFAALLHREAEGKNESGGSAPAGGSGASSTAKRRPRRSGFELDNEELFHAIEAERAANKAILAPVSASGAAVSPARRPKV